MIRESLHRKPGGWFSAGNKIIEQEKDKTHSE